MKIFTMLSEDYEENRKVFNTYFNYFPSKIIYCENEKDVVSSINFCRIQNKEFRVRSGGHHHEAFCSADNVVIIDISKIKTFKFNYQDELSDSVWIGAGLSNQEIIDNLDSTNKFIPIGSCEHVGIGGLTLGGGWNLFTRNKGLTCDSLIAMKVVLANGEVHVISEKNKPDLFKAMKGSGGGNFAVVVDFLFQTFDKNKFFTFSFEFIDHPISQLIDKAKKYNFVDVNNNIFVIKLIMMKWIKYQAGNNTDITSFLRIFHIKDKLFGLRIHGNVFAENKEDANEKVKVLIPFFNGIFDDEGISNFIEIINKSYNSNQSEIQEIYSSASDLLKNSIDPSKFVTKLSNNISSNLFDIEDYSISYKYNKSIIEEKKKIYNCKLPMGHKVSSAFVSNDTFNDPKKNEIFFDSIFDYLSTKDNENNFSLQADCYNIITFHALGGNLHEKNNSMPYKDRVALIQFQSWWNSPSKERASDNINWVVNFRNKLIENKFVDGGFVNFYDRNLTNDDYYRDKLIELTQVSKQYDEANLFRFRK